jgi:hypothetical protein
VAVDWIRLAENPFEDRFGAPASRNAGPDPMSLRWHAVRMVDGLPDQLTACERFEVSLTDVDEALNFMLGNVARCKECAEVVRVAQRRPF